MGHQRSVLRRRSRAVEALTDAALPFRRDVSLRRRKAALSSQPGGARPHDLPVEQPTKTDLVTDLLTAGSLGPTAPQSLLARADELIEDTP